MIFWFIFLIVDNGIFFCRILNFFICLMVFLMWILIFVIELVCLCVFFDSCLFDKINNFLIVYLCFKIMWFVLFLVFVEVLFLVKGGMLSFIFFLVRRFFIVNFLFVIIWFFFFRRLSRLFFWVICWLFVFFVYNFEIKEKVFDGVILIKSFIVLWCL